MLCSLGSGPWDWEKRIGVRPVCPGFSQPGLEAINGSPRCANLVTVKRSGVWDNARSMETSIFDFLYLESDPRTNQPSACLYLKSAGGQSYAGVGPDRLITPPCFSFIELDAEIRRLHAELDEVRARARRKFYKAEAAAAGD